MTYVEKITHLTIEDIGISENLGGVNDYETETLEPSNNDSYADQSGHKRRHESNRELYKKLLTVGLVGIGVMVAGCVPAGTEAYTTIFGITYLNGSEKKPAVVAHEGQHWKDYQEDPLFFLKYNFVKGYSCAAETRANEAAHIEPANSHPACQLPVTK